MAYIFKLELQRPSQLQPFKSICADQETIISIPVLEIFSQLHIHWATGLSRHNQIFPLLSLLVTAVASNLVMEKVGVVLGPIDK